jgi:hypothetical protein
MSVHHEIAGREQDPFRWIVTCTCGKEFKHRDAPAAERLCNYHAGLENSRTALNKGRTG